MYKIKYKNILLILLLISLILFFSGCGGECKKSSDCPSKTCYIVNCINKECAETPKENCCGNDICEKTETKCSCKKDCGECTGKVGTYLEYLCDGNDCITGIKEETIKKTSFTDKISIRNVGDISATYAYDQPFNIDESLFSVRFVLEKKESNIEYVKINKINVYEELDRLGVQVQTYGEKIIDQILWDTKSEIVNDVILSGFPSNITEDEKTLTVELIYEYAKLYRGDTTITSGSYKKQLKDIIYLINPSKKRKCPESCDDNNPCTTDTCSASTNYFCEHVINEGISCCGNHKCDSNEDKCSCQQDCGSCDRDFGNYIEFTCISNKCSSRLKTESVPKTLVEDATLGDIRVEMKTTFNEPFDIGVDKYIVKLELKSMASNVGNVKCTELQVISGDELLAEKSISGSLSSIGATYSSEVTTSFSMKDVEESKGTNIKLTCSYTKTVNDVTTSYIKTATQSLGIITYVNPDV